MLYRIILVLSRTELFIFYFFFSVTEGLWLWVDLGGYFIAPHVIYRGRRKGLRSFDFKDNKSL